ncbi:hypothetical protein [Granulicella sibirica]|uniref:DUF3108 domain-containing protein n=1 Tax=Granulicella sibirica TaxID=2479048 RepID=A0A4Q0T2F4_9BACT|nr:hypothetical protein [Granulicella sibirica]RXH55741.1 hypothetical protein GRAN_2598 [Granulicella sibirica]
MNGETLASGDLIQVSDGDRVTSRLTFHFRDGSLDDETTVFSQHKILRLISDRHVQKGPAYPKPMDVLIQHNGTVTMRDDAGKTSVEHIDLPPDTYNGLQFAVVANILPTTPETKIAYVAPTGKGRLIHLSITPEGEDAFTAAGVKRKAVNYRLHPELGGLTGMVAPLIGKQPEDAHVWVMQSEAPAIVKVEAQFYEGGPVWRVELTSPVWSGEPRASR